MNSAFRVEIYVCISYTSCSVHTYIDIAPLYKMLKGPDCSHIADLLKGAGANQNTICVCIVCICKRRVQCENANENHHKMFVLSEFEKYIAI